MINRDIRMNRKEKLSAGSAKSLINHFGTLLVNCIGIIDEHFFITTSHSVFLHKHDSIDDCASKSAIAFQERPVMYIRKHKRYTHDYFELSVRIGHLEFLATGGFWGPLDEKILMPFLGSSLTSLPSTITEEIENPRSTTIFTNTHATEPTCQNQ